jgi:hypothetical protein
MAGLIASQYITANPHLMEPQIMLDYFQASGFMSAFHNSEPTVKLGSEDLTVNVRRMSYRTQSGAGQSAYNNLPSVAIQMSMVSTPTYLLRARATFDHHDAAQAGVWGFGLPEALGDAMDLAIFQDMRNAGLYGMNPANGEGLLNTAGAVALPLPADSLGHTTVSTYDNGEMALFLLNAVSALRIRTKQMNQKHRIVILGPQRILAQWNIAGIVQLTSYQRAGAGSATTGDVVKNVLEDNGVTVEWAYDDTLIGKGQGGKDAIIITIPEIESPKKMSVIDTNNLANKMAQGFPNCNTMYCDMVKPRIIQSPLPLGANELLAELRITSGWGKRPEAISIMSATF